MIKQKGSALIIILIVVVVFMVAGGIFYMTQKTSPLNTINPNNVEVGQENQPNPVNTQEKKKMDEAAANLETSNTAEIETQLGQLETDISGF